MSKNTLLVLLFSITSIFVFGQKMDCAKFKEGTFKSLPQDGFPEVTIVRKGNKQTEKAAGKKGHDELIVKWIDDCTYTLTPTEKTFKKTPSLPKNAVITVTIIEVKENSYIQTTTCNFADFKLTLEIFKIK